MGTLSKGSPRRQKIVQPNLLAYNEQFDNAAWSKQNSMSALGQNLTFVTANSYVQYTNAITGYTVGQSFLLRAVLVATATTTVTLILIDAADGVPSYTQAVAVSTTPVSTSFPVTMGAGFSGNLTVQLHGANVITAGTVVTVGNLTLTA